MATGNVMPDPKFTGLDNDGNPLSGGKVYFYSAGTTSPTRHLHNERVDGAPTRIPVVLDSGGRATVYLSANAYKVKV
jgi:hypothetical protein